MPLELPLQLAEVIGRAIEELLPDEKWSAQWTCGYGIGLGDEQQVSIINEKGSTVRRRHGRTRRHKRSCYACIIKIKSGVFTAMFPVNSPTFFVEHSTLTIDKKTMEKWTYELADPGTNLDEIIPKIVERAVNAE